MKKKIATLIAFIIALLALYLIMNMNNSSDVIVSQEKAKTDQRFCPLGKKGSCYFPE